MADDTTATATPTDTPSSSLGSQYSQDADGYYSTNPSNPNAERFYSDGRPVPTVSYSNAGTGQSFSGYTTPQNFQSIINSGSAQNSSNVDQGLFNSGQIQIPKAYSAPTAPTAPTSSDPSSSGMMQSTATANPPSPIHETLNKLGYSYPNSVTDPTFLNKSPDERLQAFKTGNADAYGELNRIKSMYSQTTDPTQQANIHNWADQVRQAAGIPTDDPFYGNGSAPTSQGSLNVNVNGQNASQANTYNGTSYETADQLAKDLGLKLTMDPKTGIPSFNGTPIYTYNKDANGNVIVPTRMVANALGYQVNYDPKSGSVGITGGSKQSSDVSGTGTGTGTGQGVQPGINPGVGQGGFGITPFTGAGAGAGVGTGTFGFGGNQPASGFIGGGTQQPSDQQPSALPIQSQFNPDWANYYNQAHAQIDPLYQSKVNDLNSRQAGNIAGMDEKMNHRGIFTSGIAQAAENDLRAKTTNSVAGLFNKQMSDIEKTAQGLYNNAFKQYSTGNNFNLKYNQDQINNYMNGQKQIFTQWLGTQKLDLSQQQYALNAWDKTATMQLNQMKAMLPYQYQTANNIATNQTSAANNAATNQSANDRAMIPYTQGPTPYQQSDLAIKQQAQTMSDYFKQQGLNISAAHLEEAIRHDQTTEGLTANGQAITSAHNQATEGLTARGQNITAAHNSATEANSAAALSETIQRDKAHAQDAIHSAKDADARSLLTSYNDQLHGVETELNRITTSGAYDLKDAGNIKILENLKSARQQIVDNMDAVAKGVANPPKGGGK